MWAAAPVGEDLWVSQIGKFKPFHGHPAKLASAAALHVSLHIHSICDVQERLPEMPASSSVFPGVVVGH
jgi:hypothetical protein